jgi:hypothetical protein
VAKIAAAPQAPLADPCVLGTCTKVEVNATTGVTTILPLTLADLAQRYKDAQGEYQRQIELAKVVQTPVVVTSSETATASVLPSLVSVKALKVKNTKIKAKKKAAIK